MGQTLVKYEFPCFDPDCSFKVVFGQDPPPLLGLENYDTTNGILEQLMERDRLLMALKENSLMAQNRMKKFAALNRRELEFEEGDYVFLNLRPYR